MSEKRGIPERVLAWAGDPGSSDNPGKLATFRSLLILHTAIQSAHFLSAASASDSNAKSTVIVMWVVLITQASAFAFSFSPRWTRYAAISVFFTLLYQQSWYFPDTTNHFYLSTWMMFMLALVETVDADDSEFALQALRWSAVIVLFYTGFQKLLYGTYFHGDFLAYNVASSARFSDIFQWVLSADELARLSAIDPTQHGAGPYRTTEPLFLLVSNSVYIAEMGMPILLMLRRTRVVAAWMAIFFVVSIQLGARELIFSFLFTNILGLFLPRSQQRILLPVLVVLYLYAFGMSHSWLPGSGFLSDSPGVVGVKHI